MSWISSRNSLDCASLCKEIEAPLILPKHIHSKSEESKVNYTVIPLSVLLRDRYTNIFNNPQPTLIDRSHPPPSTQKFTPLPLAFEQTRLSNGVPLYLIPHQAQPFLSLRLLLKRGARNDGPLPGLADITCDLLSAGAGSRDAITFAADVERLGANLGVEASRDVIRLELDTLTRFLPEAIPLAADMVLRPLFDPDELKRERKQKLSTLKQNRSEPDWLAATALRRTLYGSNPYGHPIEGEKDSVARITIEDCKNFHHQQIIPAHAMFIVAGDVTVDEIQDRLEAGFSGWRGDVPSLIAPVIPQPAAGGRLLILDRPGSAHTAIRIGRIGLSRKDPEAIPLLVLNTLLGDYFNSRLNNLLRESMGFTYEAWSYVEMTVDPGMIVVGTSVRADRVAKTVGAIFGELDRIASKEVGEEELEIVKGYIAGRQALASETPDQIAGMVTTIALHDLPADYYRTFIEQIRSLTPEDLLKTAKRFLRSEDMTVVVAGDAEKLRSELAPFGRVEIVRSK